MDVSYGPLSVRFNGVWLYFACSKYHINYWINLIFIIILLLLLNRNLQGSKEISRKRDLKWVSWRPVWSYIYPLSPKSDQHQFSLNIFHMSPIGKVKRICWNDHQREKAFTGGTSTFSTSFDNLRKKLIKFEKRFTLTIYFTNLSTRRVCLA